MYSATNEVNPKLTLPWLVIREDDRGNRYRVGRYATRAEAEKISDSLDQRGHRQLYWVERLGRGQETPLDEGQDVVQGFSSPIQRAIGPTPPRLQESVDTAEDEPQPSTGNSVVRTVRRLRRARPLFEALVHILPADERERWCEEWLAEWADLGERPVRIRVAFLLRIALRGPYFAWTLRLATRRQRAR